MRCCLKNHGSAVLFDARGKGEGKALPTSGAFRKGFFFQYTTDPLFFPYIFL